MKKKVLVVIQLVRRGGVELVAINFARKLDKTKFNISFLLIDPYVNQDEELLNELKAEGFRFFEMPREATGYIQKYKYMNKLMAEEHFDIVHSHVILFSGIVLLCARKNSVETKIAHSHVIKWNRKENIAYKLYKAVMQMLLRKNSDVKIGCSQAAGEYLFGRKEFDKNGNFIPNGVDTDKFSFNKKYREEIRNELEIKTNELLVGHIGTIYKIKNQTFLVKIFAQMLRERPNARLVLVGEMVDVNPVIDIARELGVYDKVIFAGQRNDIFKFYSALDIMIFPSLHEALPLSLIEAQSAKLPCLISDTVTTEVKYNDNVDFMSLEASELEWCNRASDLININREDIQTNKLVETYDINRVIFELEDIYLK